MGVLWVTYPLNDKAKEWLDSEGIVYPETKSRFPTGSEVKETLNGLKDLKVEITDNGVGKSWQASIESKTSPKELWTVLIISEYSGDDKPQEICFSKGHDEIIKLVLKNICQRCGPLVLIPDTGDTPEVIIA